MVECLLCMQKVVGSNPTTSKILLDEIGRRVRLKIYSFFKGVGSNPTVRNLIFNIFLNKKYYI